LPIDFFLPTFACQIFGIINFGHSTGRPITDILSTPVKA
jgi:hypothetical protein